MKTEDLKTCFRKIEELNGVEGSTAAELYQPVCFVRVLGRVVRLVHDDNTLSSVLLSTTA